MMSIQKVVETKAGFRGALSHIQLATFLLMALLILLTTNANAQDDGVRWQVKLDPANEGKVAITVNPMDMKAGLYISNMRCKVLFFNANNEQIGDRLYNFSGARPRSLFAKTPAKKKLFSSAFSSATYVKGDDMIYKIFREGGKADGPSEFVKDGRIVATP